MLKRYLTNRFPKESFFLFGPRQTGKTTLLKEIETVFYADLLDPDEHLAYTKNPNLLKERIAALPQKGTIVIDEIQRVPMLLDVVQQILDSQKDLRLIMSGSSARKLRHGYANLLGGRAIYLTIHPLTASELEEQFKLDWVMAFGSLPKIYSCLVNGDMDLATSLLRSYVTTYIREEIKSEALVRNLQGFQNFLDVAAAQFAEQVNLLDISRECHVAYTTVREYYSILEDTLMGFFIRPYSGSERKRMSLAPKFYFFDNGVTRALLGALRDEPSPLERGRLFEQWVVQEIVRINEYEQKDWRLSFWRTSHGAEVDIIIERRKKILCAIECKCKNTISNADASGLNAFLLDRHKVPAYIVAPVKFPQRLGEIQVLPLGDLIESLKNF